MRGVTPSRSPSFFVAHDLVVAPAEKRLLGLRRLGPVLCEMPRVRTKISYIDIN